MTPAIGPEMGAILERLRAAPGLDFRAMPVAEARPLVDAATIPWSQGAPAMAARDLVVPLDGRGLAARLYEPADAADEGVIVYAHGGGWTFGSIETHDGTMRVLAEAARRRVLGVDYRLAPEPPFPAPLDDVLGAVAFVEAGGLGRPLAADRIALSGDSAGATLALGALLARRDRGLAPLAGAGLFYGCYAPDCDTPSHAAFGDGRYLLSTANMRWYWGNFLDAGGPDPAHYATPLRAELSGLPPLYLAAAGLDPLRDDTLALAAALARAGVAARCDHVPGVVHGCLRMARELPPALAMIRAGAAHLAECLGTEARR